MVRRGRCHRAGLVSNDHMAEGLHGGRRPRPVADVPPPALADGEAAAKAWLLALVAARPLATVADLPAVELARDAPGLCAGVLAAVGSDHDLEALAPGGESADLAVRAARLAGASTPSAVVAAVASNTVMVPNCRPPRRRPPTGVDAPASRAARTGRSADSPPGASASRSWSEPTAARTPAQRPGASRASSTAGRSATVASGRAATRARSHALAAASPSASAGGGTSATGRGRRPPWRPSAMWSMDTSPARWHRPAPDHRPTPEPTARPDGGRRMARAGPSPGAPPPGARTAGRRRRAARRGRARPAPTAMIPPMPELRSIAEARADVLAHVRPLALRGGRGRARARPPPRRRRARGGRRAGLRQQRHGRLRRALGPGRADAAPRRGEPGRGALRRRARRAARPCGRRPAPRCPRAPTASSSSSSPTRTPPPGPSRRATRSRRGATCARPAATSRRGRPSCARARASAPPSWASRCRPAWRACASGRSPRRRPHDGRRAAPARRRARGGSAARLQRRGAGRPGRRRGRPRRPHAAHPGPRATRRAPRSPQALGSARVVLLSGGVSVGPHDHVKAALAHLGVREVFWRVALRPGQADVVRHGRRPARLRPPREPGLLDGHVPALRAARARGAAGRRPRPAAGPRAADHRRGAQPGTRRGRPGAPGGRRGDADRRPELAPADLDARGRRARPRPARRGRAPAPAPRSTSSCSCAASAARGRR